MRLGALWGLVLYCFSCSAGPLVLLRDAVFDHGKVALPSLMARRVLWPSRFALVIVTAVGDGYIEVAVRRKDEHLPSIAALNFLVRHNPLGYLLGRCDLALKPCTSWQSKYAHWLPFRVHYIVMGRHRQTKSWSILSDWTEREEQAWGGLFEGITQLFILPACCLRKDPGDKRFEFLVKRGFQKEWICFSDALPFGPIQRFPRKSFDPDAMPDDVLSAAIKLFQKKSQNISLRLSHDPSVLRQLQQAKKESEQRDAPFAGRSYRYVRDSIFLEALRASTTVRTLAEVIIKGGHI